jgi:hypothetical protein
VRRRRMRWQIYIVAETDSVTESALYSFCVK